MHARLAEFMRFCIVGVIAFIADAGGLFALVSLGMPDLLARALSLTCGMHVAYVLNARFTYRGHAGITVATWLSFVSSNLVGAAINYLIFWGVLSLAPLADAHASRLLAIVCGTGVGLVFNYWANRRFAFRSGGGE